MTIPAGVDWLLDSPRDGEGHLTSAYSRKAVVSAAYQPHDLLGMSNAEDVMDDLLRDLYVAAAALAFLPSCFSRTNAQHRAVATAGMATRRCAGASRCSRTRRRSK